jgi:HD-like signal output (HDOD) protein
LGTQQGSGQYPGGDTNPRGSGLWATSGDGSAPVLAVQALVGAAGDLEPLSPSACKLAALLARGDWALDEVVRIVGYDPVLSAQLLHAANSAQSGPISQVGSVDAAIMRLGPARVLSTTVAHSVREPFVRASEEYGLAEGQLWRHSVAAGLAAERMHGYLPQAPPLECPTAALLHDLGHLVLARSLPTDVKAVLASESHKGWLGSRKAEQDLLGSNHARVGGALAGHWRLSPVLVDAIAHHHTPNEVRTARGAHVAHVVSLADMVASTIGESLGDRERKPVDEGASMLKLSLSGEQFSRLCQEVFDDLEDVLRWYE